VIDFDLFFPSQDQINFPFCCSLLKGGAISVAGGATTAEFIDVVIEGNIALNGGAIYAQSGTLSFINSVIKQNAAVGPKMVVEKGGCTSVGSCIFSVGLIHFTSFLFFFFLPCLILSPFSLCPLQTKSNYPSDYNSNELCKCCLRWKQTWSIVTGAPACVLR
jgi:predicted outer membrane repeat protein